MSVRVTAVVRPRIHEEAQGRSRAWRGSAAAIVAASALVLGLPLSALAGDEDSTPTAIPPPPCQDAGFRQLDFWVGTWDLTWDGGTGTNVVTRDEYGDCVVIERFADDAEGGLHGTSMSTYDARHEVWRQTWVDNNGSYMDFTGGWDGERMTLGRTIDRDGTSIRQRMVFHDISADSLTWDWQSSTDGGETWAMRWQIGYKRRK